MVGKAAASRGLQCGALRGDPRETTRERAPAGSAGRVSTAQTIEAQLAPARTQKRAACSSATEVRRRTPAPARAAQGPTCRRPPRRRRPGRTEARSHSSAAARREGRPEREHWHVARAGPGTGRLRTRGWTGERAGATELVAAGAEADGGGVAAGSAAGPAGAVGRRAASAGRAGEGGAPEEGPSLPPEEEEAGAGAAAGEGAGAGAGAGVAAGVGAGAGAVGAVGPGLDGQAQQRRGHAMQRRCCRGAECV